MNEKIDLLMQMYRQILACLDEDQLDEELAYQQEILKTIFPTTD